MCKWGITKKIWVNIPADLTSTGKIEWKRKNIDSCIANLVNGMQKGGIDMRGSCCGHGKSLGDIHLQDGRILIIATEEWLNNKIRYLIQLLIRHIVHKIKLWIQLNQDKLGWRK